MNNNIIIKTGDITKENVCAIVNAANSSLMGGGGVDGAIHRAGGPAIMEAARKIRQEQYPDGLPTGKAVATTGGKLPAKFVIHTVGPVYRVVATAVLLFYRMLMKIHSNWQLSLDVKILHSLLSLQEYTVTQKQKRHASPTRRSRTFWIKGLISKSILYFTVMRINNFLKKR